MAIVPAAYVNPAKLQSAVAQAQRALAPMVKRIRFSLGEDSSGSDSVFFRVLLSDKESQGDLRTVSLRVTSKLFDLVAPDRLGLKAYFSFRSVSEQLELQDPDWE